MANSSSGESVLSRIVRIVGSFDDGKPGMGVAAIARRAGIPLATTHRLVAGLVDVGWLEHQANGEVRIGLRLWELVNRNSAVLGLRQAAMPFMEDIQAVVHQHTQLGVLEGDEVLFLERLSSRGSVVNEARVAGRLPAHVSSSGMVLLAFSPRHVQESYLRRHDDGLDAAQLRRDLAGIRQAGYAALTGQVVEETTGIAVPVLAGTGRLGAGRQVAGRPVAALGVVVAAGEENIPAIVPALMTAARGLARAVGQVVPGTGRRT